MHQTQFAPCGVYGVLFNFQSALEALGDLVNRPPYQAPPRAPVLYIKPANTWTQSGDTIHLPPGEQQVECGGTLGIEIGSITVRVREESAFDHVAGLRLVNDWTLPEASFYRPAIRERCRDGFCSIGERSPPSASSAQLAQLSIRTFINGVARQESSLRELVRPVPRLLAEISEFMTLFPGDLVLVGVAAGAPRAGAGDVVVIEADGVGRLENTVIAADRAAERAIPHSRAAP